MTRCKTIKEKGKNKEGISKREKNAKRKAKKINYSEYISRKRKSALSLSKPSLEMT
jgi:hypothetical protein